MISGFLQHVRPETNLIQDIRSDTDKKRSITKILSNVKTGLFDSVHAHARTFPGKSAFRRQFFRGYYAPVPISSFDQGCAWIFDRRARPQWEICTAKRITDVFVRLVTMGSRLEPIPWFGMNRESFLRFSRLLTRQGWTLPNHSPGVCHLFLENFLNGLLHLVYFPLWLFLGARDTEYGIFLIIRGKRDKRERNIRKMRIIYKIYYFIVNIGISYIPLN